MSNSGGNNLDTLLTNPSDKSKCYDISFTVQPPKSVHVNHAFMDSVTVVIMSPNSRLVLKPEEKICVRLKLFQIPEREVFKLPGRLIASFPGMLLGNVSDQERCIILDAKMCAMLGGFDPQYIHTSANHKPTDQVFPFQSFVFPNLVIDTAGYYLIRAEAWIESASNDKRDIQYCYSHLIDVTD